MHKSLLLLATAALALPAQTLTVLVDFNGVNGAGPSGGLILASDGNYYGVTGGGGSGYGTVFKLSPGGILTTIHSFSQGEGIGPTASLVQGKDGNFYGTTSRGGSGGGIAGYGTVFKVTPDGALTTLYSFTPDSGYTPNTALVQGKDGNFYGTTSQGGPGGFGTLYRITPSGSMTVVHAFAARDDGRTPAGGLMSDADGNLYGVTQLAGSGGRGTIFKLSPAGVFEVLHSFSGPDGDSPTSALIRGADGNFYGATYYGGAGGAGTVFRLTPEGVLTTLHSLSAGDGYGPLGALLQAGDGNFYGTTQGVFGTIFRVTPDGEFTTLHTFSGSNASGFRPNGELIQASGGAIYGFTSQGGKSNFGTVFQLTIGGLVRPPGAITGPASSVADVSVLLSASVSANGAETQAWFEYGPDSSMAAFRSTLRQNLGAGQAAVPFVVPVTGLTPDTTYYFRVAASNSSGTSRGPVATFTTAGAPAYTVSGIITASGAGLGGARLTVEGSQAASTTVTDTEGRYAFTVPSGGNYTITPAADGYVFIPPSVSFTGLHADQTASFVAVAVAPVSPPVTVVSFNGNNGAAPRAGLIQTADGKFYGVTSKGGANNKGTVFQLSSSTVATLHSFTGADGSAPGGGLLRAADGNLYGATLTGGTSDTGVLYRITTAGQFTALQSFGGNNGAYPAGALVEAADGNLYGTTSGSGAFSPATVFRLTPAGAFTTTYTFASILGGGPAAGLIEGTDRSFYGTLRGGSVTSQPGLVFRLTRSGSLVSLYNFCAMSNCADGLAPEAPLAQGPDGSLYGTTSQGGANNGGVIFRIAPDGGFTVLHSFSLADGSRPGALLLASDGNLYGTTAGGGANGYGTVFQLTASGVFTSVHSFSMTDGANPQGALLQAADGSLYGTTEAGGSSGNGTVFRIALPPSVPVIFPSSGLLSGASFQPGIAAGAWITILGRNLSPKADTWDAAIVDGALPQSLDGVRVTVAGKPAYIAYVSPGQINALAPDVPEGPVSVTVTNSSGTSAPVTIAARTVQPAFFTWGNYAVATRTDYTLAVKNGALSGRNTVPAKPGEVIILWGTGFGPTTPAAAPGSIPPAGVIYNTANPVEVTIGGIPSTVYGAALTPGNAGLYQIAIQVPAALGDGDYPVVATISGAQSPGSVLLSVIR